MPSGSISHSDVRGFSSLKKKTGCITASCIMTEESTSAWSLSENRVKTKVSANINTVGLMILWVMTSLTKEIPHQGLTNTNVFGLRQLKTKHVTSYIMSTSRDQFSRIFYSGNLRGWIMKLTQKCQKLQFFEWPLEAGSKRESISIHPHVKTPSPTAKRF